MDQPRGVGQPVKTDGVGRTIILERTRTALRERPRADLQRQELATYARVTAALISYYFPDRSSLFAAAAQPVLEQYIADLRRILGSDDAPLGQLKSLTSLLVDFNFREGYLLDFCLAHLDQRSNTTVTDQLTDIDGEMIGFFDKLLRGQVLRGACAHTLQSTLRGMCKHVAYRLRKEAPQKDLNAVIGARAELIFDCFSNGVSGLPCFQDISSAA